MNLWLNLLQTIALPFALIPLMHFTSSRRVMGAYWANHVVLLVVGSAISLFAVFMAIYCTIESTPFPTTSWGVGLTWFGWALYILVILYFALGPDNCARWWGAWRRTGGGGGAAEKGAGAALAAPCKEGVEAAVVGNDCFTSPSAGPLMPS